MPFVQPSHADPAVGPLSGVRVVELCWVWAGPLLGQFLADLGAEVIKCEWYRRHDPYRTRGVERLRGVVPEARRRELSASFHSLNRNKVGLAADLKSGQGLDMVKDVIRASDVVIENFTAGTMEKVGLGPDVLGELNPELVSVSLSGFGRGPLERMRAYGLVLSALGGAEVGYVDDGEFLGSPTFVVSDPNAALFGLFASVAGLLAVRRSGAGGAFQCSQLEAIMSVVHMPEPPRERADVTVQARDGRYVAVSVPDGVALDAAGVEGMALERAAERLVRDLHALGAVAAPILDVSETLSHEVFADPPVRLTAQHPVGGPEELVASPWRIGGRRSPLRKTAPLLGEGDDYVLRAVVGCSDEEIRERIQPEPVRVGPTPTTLGIQGG
jgi:crotonobetainyl-CoA:carnitine CoA-transferase CaiB-like acyl-CoA transferase